MSGFFCGSGVLLVLYFHLKHNCNFWKANECNKKVSGKLFFTSFITIFQTVEACCFPKKSLIQNFIFRKTLRFTYIQSFWRYDNLFSVIFQLYFYQNKKSWSTSPCPYMENCWRKLLKKASEIQRRNMETRLVSFFASGIYLF